MEGQKGDCGDTMASVDPHGLCVRCRECNLVSAPCSVCVAMTPEQREAALLAHARRQRRLQRRKDRASRVCSSSSKHSSGSVTVDRPTLDPPVAGRGDTGTRQPLHDHGWRTAALIPLPRSHRYGETVARDPRSPHLRMSMAGEAPLSRGRLTANQLMMAVVLTARSCRSNHAVG